MAKKSRILYILHYLWVQTDEENRVTISELRKELEDQGFHANRKTIAMDLKELQENGVRIIFIGERRMLDDDIIRQMAHLEEATAANEKMTLCIALSYGSRQEIVSAAQKIAALAKRGDISPEDVDIKMFSDMLYTKDMPDPDLLIRTSGEQRISNYLLWQIAYAELFFTPTLWPDFGKEELASIIQNFNQRERRYGKV